MYVCTYVCICYNVRIKYTCIGKCSGIESDLWALGVIVYQLIFGVTPYAAQTPYLNFLRIKRGNYRVSKMYMSVYMLNMYVYRNIYLYIKSDSPTQSIRVLVCIDMYRDVCAYMCIIYAKYHACILY